MPLTRLAADAFGVVTISLVSLTAILGLLCIYRSVHFNLRIQRSGLLQLSFFNGPWVTRIVLILVAIWWGVGEVARLSLLKGKNRLFTDITWQKNTCKFYMISNLGFAEPSMFLMLVFLLHASLQKRDSGTLSPRWNRKTVAYVLCYCFPLFITQLVLILVGPQMNQEKDGTYTRMTKFFKSSYLHRDIMVCAYPLLSTILLGLFYALLISYLSFVGTRLLSLVINKGLRFRVYLLILSVIIFAPLRVLLLGFSVLPKQGHAVFETLVFLAFFVLLFCIVVGIFMLVYFPVVDSLGVGDARRTGHTEIQEMPYDDYYYDGASLIATQSNNEIGGSSNASTKHGSISFRAMIKDDSSVMGPENSSFSSESLCIVTQSGPSQASGRPMIPLREFSKNPS